MNRETPIRSVSPVFSLPPPPPRGRWFVDTTYLDKKCCPASTRSRRTKRPKTRRRRLRRLQLPLASRLRPGRPVVRPRTRRRRPSSTPSSRARQTTAGPSGPAFGLDARGWPSDGGTTIAGVARDHDDGRTEREDGAASVRRGDKQRTRNRATGTFIASTKVGGGGTRHRRPRVYATARRIQSVPKRHDPYGSVERRRWRWSVYAPRCVVIAGLGSLSKRKLFGYCCDYYGHDVRGGRRRQGDTADSGKPRCVLANPSVAVNDANDPGHNNKRLLITILAGSLLNNNNMSRT